MDDLEAIMVAKPVYIQFQTILTQTHKTSNSLMEHFFSLYNSSLNQISSVQEEATNHLLRQKGGNYSQVVVNIPRSILRRDISVNVTIPERDKRLSSDTEYNSEDSSPPVSLICNTGFNETSKEADLFGEVMEHIKEKSVRENHRTFSCDHCTFKTKGFRKFQNHIRKHSEKQMECQYCGQAFLDQSKLSYHIENKHEHLVRCNAEIQATCHLGKTVPPLNIERNAYEKVKLPTIDRNIENVTSLQSNSSIQNAVDYTSTINRGDNSTCLEKQNCTISLRNNDNFICQEASYINQNKSQIFQCGLCGSKFSKYSLFIKHEKFCRRNRGHIICHCKKKFQWKSQFLHHKKKCEVVRNHLQNQRNKFKNNLFKIRHQNNENYEKGNFLNRRIVSSQQSEVKTIFNNASVDLNNRKSLDDLTSDNMKTSDMPLEMECDIRADANEDLNPDEVCMNKNGEYERENYSFINEVYESPEQLSVLVNLPSLNGDETNATNEIVQPVGSTREKETTDVADNFRTCNLNINKIVENIKQKNLETKCQITGNVGQNLNFKNNPDVGKVRPNLNLNDLPYSGNIGPNLNPETILESVCQVRGKAACPNSTAISKMDDSVVDLSIVKKEPAEPEQEVKNTSLEHGKNETLKNLQVNQSLFNPHNLAGTFSDGNNLFGHLADDDETNLKCEECGEVFKRKAYLKEHMEGKHGGDLRYSCECGKKFKWRSSLGNHRKHCYQALLSFLPQEGQGQNISVIDFSQCNIPFLQMQGEWQKDLEKMSQSFVLGKSNFSLNQDQENRRRHMTSPERVQKENPQGQIHMERRKSDGAANEQDRSLRIDSAFVKPFADALSKYQQKTTIHNQRENDNGPNIDKQPIQHLNKIIPKENLTKKMDGSYSNGVIDLTIGQNTPNRQANQPIQTGQKLISSKESTYSNAIENFQPSEKSRTSIRSNSSDSLQTKQIYPQQWRNSLQTVECNLCKENFSKIGDLKRHKLYCKHLEDTCSVCGKTFLLRSDLVNHLLTYHGGDDTYMCFCGYRANDWNIFENHCETCNEFKSQSNSFLSNEKIKRSRPETKSANNPSTVDLLPLPDFAKFSANQNSQLEHHNHDNLSRKESRSTSNKHFTMENGTLVQQTLQNQHLNTQVTDNHRYQANNSSQVHKEVEQSSVDQMLPMTTVTMLPTISSFVTSSATNQKPQDFSRSQTVPSQLLDRDSINQSKTTNIESDKKNVFVCTFCGNVYNNLDKFSEHNKIHHHGNQPVAYVKKYNQQKTAVEVAIDKSRQLPIKMAQHVCHLCGDVFAAKAYLKEHISGKHGTVDRYKCPCGMRFKWRSSLGIHQKKCPKSNKRTYNRWNSS